MGVNNSEELISLLKRSREGDDLAFAELYKAYTGMIKKFVITFSDRLDMPGEDVEQEALLAFSRAVGSYDLQSEGITFGLYSKICIKNALISLERKRKTQKRREWNLSKGSGGADRTSRDGGILFPSEGNAERMKKLLTPFENEVLLMFADGSSYDEIANELGVSKKKVDNTLYRLRKKLKSISGA